MENPKENILIFTSPSIKKPKKWISALMALIFFFGSFSPAWARPGNVGDDVDAWQMFALGGLAAFATQYSMSGSGGSSSAGKISTSTSGGVGGAAGSIAGDLTYLYNYYYNYHTSGETVFSCKVFGTKVEIDRATAYSAAAGIVASWGTQSASMAYRSLATSVTRTVAETAKAVYYAILSLIYRLLSHFIKMILIKWTEEFLVQKAHIKRILVKAFFAVIELVYKAINSLFNGGIKVTKNEDGSYSKNGEKIKGSTETTTKKDGTDETIFTAEDGTKDGTKYRVVEDSKTGDTYFFKIHGTAGNIFNAVLSAIVLLTTGIGVDALLSEIVGAITGLYVTNYQWVIPKSEKDNENYLQNTRVSYSDKKTGASKDEAKLKLKVDAKIEYNPEYLEKKDGSQENKDSPQYSSGYQLTAGSLNAGTEKLEDRVALDRLTPYTLYDLLTMNAEVKDQTGKITKVPLMVLLNAKKVGDGYEINGQIVKVLGVNGNPGISVAGILNVLKTADLNKLREVQVNAQERGLVPRNPQGQPLQDLPLFNGGILGELSSRGYVSNLKTIITIVLLELFNHEEYNGSDKERSYRGLLTEIASQSIADILGGMAANWDDLGRFYSGSGSNPWSTFPKNGKMSYWKSVAHLVANEVSAAAAQIGFAHLAKNSKLNSALQGVSNLMLGSVVSASVDALLRQDPGKAEEVVYVGETDFKNLKYATEEGDGLSKTVELTKSELDDIYREEENYSTEDGGNRIIVYSGSGNAEKRAEAIYDRKERYVDSSPSDPYYNAKLHLFSSGYRDVETGAYISNEELNSGKYTHNPSVDSVDGKYIVVYKDGKALGVYEKESPLESWGRFGLGIPENFNNVLHQGIMDSILWGTPYRSSGIGLDAGQPWQANQDRWIRFMESATQGISPTQILAAILGQNLTQHAAQDVGNSLGYAIANNWLPQEYRQYAAFMPTATQISAKLKKKNLELEETEKVITKAKKHSQRLTSLKQTKEAWEKRRAAWEEKLASTDLYKDEQSFEDGKNKMYEIENRIAAIDKEIIRLTSTAEVSQEEITAAKEPKVAEADSGVPQGVVAEIEKTTGEKLNFKDDTSASQYIAPKLPQAIESLERKAKSLREEIRHLKNERILMRASSAIPFAGAVGVAMIGGPRGGIIDYTVDRSINHSLPMSEPTKDAVSATLETRNKEKSVPNKALWDKGKETGQDWQLVSKYNPSVAGVPIETETYANNSLLQVTLPFLQMVREARSQTSMIVDISEEELKTKYQEYVKAGEELSKIADEKERVKKRNEYLDKILQNGLSAQEKATARSVMNIVYYRGISADMINYTYLTGDPAGKKEKVETVLREIDQGRTIYHQNYSLAESITRDRFGRPQETSYYTQENTGNGWQNVKEDKATEHFYGPFGHVLSVTKDYTQMNLPKEWCKTIETTETKRQEPTTKTVDVEVPGTTIEKVKMPDKEEIRKSRKEARAEDWVLKALSREEIEKRLVSKEFSKVREELEARVPAWWSKRGYDKNNDFNKLTLRACQIFAIITDSPENMRKWEAMSSPEEQEEYIGRLENYLSVWDRENTDKELNPGVKDNMIFDKNELSRLTFNAPGTFSRNIVWGNYSTVFVPIEEITTPPTIRQETRPDTKEVTEKITKETPLPFSTGPNTSYDLSLYSIGEGSSPYAGPSYRLNAYEINSGPRLAAGVNYYLAPGQRVIAMRKQAEQMLMAPLEKKILGKESPLKRNVLNAEELKQVEKRAEVLTPILEKDYQDYALSTREKAKDELFKEIEANGTLIGVATDTSWYSRDLPDSVLGLSEEKIFKQWWKERGEWITANDLVVKELAEKGAQEDIGLSQDLSQVQGMQLSQYTEIAGRDYPLPLWGLRVGYDFGGKAQFNRSQENPYDLGEIAYEINKAKDSAKFKKNQSYLKFLSGIDIYSYPLGKKAFVSMPDSPDYLSAFYKYNTRIGDRIQVEDFGADPVIPFEDVIGQVELTVVNAPEKTGQYIKMTESVKPESINQPPIPSEALRPETGIEKTELRDIEREEAKIGLGEATAKLKELETARAALNKAQNEFDSAQKAANELENIAKELDKKYNVALISDQYRNSDASANKLSKAGQEYVKAADEFKQAVNKEQEAYAQLQKLQETLPADLEKKIAIQQIVVGALEERVKVSESNPIPPAQPQSVFNQTRSLQGPVIAEHIPQQQIIEEPIEGNLPKINELADSSLPLISDVVNNFKEIRDSYKGETGIIPVDNKIFYIPIDRDDFEKILKRRESSISDIQASATTVSKLIGLYSKNSEGVASGEITPAEQKILNGLQEKELVEKGADGSYKIKQDAALIIIPTKYLGNSNVSDHELIHAFFSTNEEYRKQVENIWNVLPDQIKENFLRALKEGGYKTGSKSNYLSEFAAYSYNPEGFVKGVGGVRFEHTEDSLVIHPDSWSTPSREALMDGLLTAKENLDNVMGYCWTTRSLGLTAENEENETEATAQPLLNEDKRQRPNLLNGVLVDLDGIEFKPVK